MKKEHFEIIHEEIFMHDDQGEKDPVVLFCSHENEVIKYFTVSTEGILRNFESTKHPEHLTDDERHRILNYCLSSFDKDEIVNYNDLFIQGEFIKEIK